MPKATGQSAGAGNAVSHQPRQQQHEDEVHREAERHAQRAGGQADHARTRRRRLRAMVRWLWPSTRSIAQSSRWPAGEAARGQRHGHGAEQRREQRHQVEEFLGAVQRLPHLGPAALERFDAHAAHLGLLHFACGPVGERCDRAVARRRPRSASSTRLAGCTRCVAGRSACVDHHARREVQEAGAAVRLQRDHARDAQPRVAEQQRVAELQAQRIEHRRIDPGFAAARARRASCTPAVRAAWHLEAAAQRIARGHGLERDQPARAALRIGRARHGRESRAWSTACKPSARAPCR